MSDYHVVYRGNGETTEWDDLQVKLGNKEKPPPRWSPEKYRPQEEVVKDEKWLEQCDEDELSDLEDEFADDTFLEEYRKKRLEELRNEKKALTFGAVEQISAVDFVREVTNAGEGIWVVVHLFKDSVPECQVLGLCLEELAAKFPHTKFRRIISTECIPKYPDSNLPTVLIYKDGQCLKSLAGLLPFGGKRTTPEQVAFTLNRFGPICRSEGEEHSAEPTMEELKKFMEKFVIDTIESRDEDADT
eukprot:CAMPEP_0177604380 /NCGR_PEP_ID=MMETSP0419_2-20121207/16082_1 /TAXON_ID=582737 /ORGANISM="Tetraselmis sp., Strain GSL018" /LENGTH=244 /DNA_ID=CAMNT_0019098349 /DNA_START=87 /DNA_END=821 /DNA_ORIENTATION=-